ncbi:hypothetical protein PGT21_035489 [Puccinia graminis f. sp. tritici]|uniref:Uncharacterized protein n=1 Tax=Puccinia graminis f. sp. tritici TaxID=56615 RepID=A0A5B0N8E4_PUCGR|nr:hypothetical protein PGT21_035489 [Puccinia graminis f. sp. tritici]
MVKGYPSRIPAIPWRIPARDSGYPPGDSDSGRGCIAQAAAAAPPVAVVGGQYASCIGRRHPSPTTPPSDLTKAVDPPWSDTIESVHRSRLGARIPLRASWNDDQRTHNPPPCS